MDFLDSMVSKAKADIKTIVLPESNDPRVVKAASMIATEGIANVILLGDRYKIESVADGADLSKVQIVNHLNSQEMREYALEYYEMRKAKGVSYEAAEVAMRDPLYFGVMMVKRGLADGMVAGSLSSTANTLRPALQILKTAKDSELVSSFFVMVVPDCEYGSNGTFIYSDCGLVENPDANQLANIAVASGRSFKSLVGEEPKVAMLSYSTYGSAESELTRKVKDATRIARQKTQEFEIDGELQADAALVRSVGEFKAPGSRIAGSANVLVFPDLNSGNIAYKLTQRLAKAKAYGPITQGLAKPVNDLSRGCSAEDIVGVVAITAGQAQNLIFSPPELVLI